jgi:hypothetical protein
VTTIVPFQPSAQSTFQFQPTLDGQTYSAVVTWSLFGKRYYINLYALDGTLIVSEAMVGSPTGISIQSLSWYLGTVTLTCVVPHLLKIGTTVKMSVSGCLPDGYNGTFLMLAASPTTLTYSVSSSLDGGTQLGSVSSNIDLIAGYGFASTLVYRTASQQFEINP